MPRLELLDNQICELAYHFGAVSFDTSPERGWVIIEDFPLPRGFNCKSCPLLIRLPNEYPDLPPMYFAIPAAVRDRNGRIDYRTGSSRDQQNLQASGWRQFCYTIKSWDKRNDLGFLAYLAYRILDPSQW